MASEPDPRWMDAAWRAVTHEIAAYFATAWSVVVAPARFAREWSDGTRRALNPLAFQLNALAVIGPWRALWGRLLDPNRPATPLWFDVGKAALPFVGNAIGMTLIHALVRLGGGRRPLRSSLAMAFYVAGGPVAIVGFVLAPLSLYGFLHQHTAAALASAAANLGLFALLVGYSVVTIAALQRVSRARVAAAVAVSWLAYGAVWAWLSWHRPELVRSLLSG